MSEDTGRLAGLQSSARGWHGVQLAVLGFIGLCGVLAKNGDAGNPRWLQILAGLLVLSALVLSCVATALVASAAWPLYGARRSPAPDSGDAYNDEVTRTGRQLRLGIWLTYVAVALTALGATSSWWPREGPDSTPVEVTTNAGVACGVLRESRPGVLALDSGGRDVVLELSDVVQVRPVSVCR